MIRKFMEQALINSSGTRTAWSGTTAQAEPVFYGRDDYEYLLVIHPDMEVYSKVLSEKQRFHEEYEPESVRGGKPHITLGSFVARESMEETLIRWIQRVCSREQSFMVTLNNYSGIPPHTVYLRVQDHLPFHSLVQKLVVINEYVQSNGCPPVKWNNRPYLSISGRLSENVYEQAMLDYSQKTFFEVFTAKELVLLRKSPEAEAARIINIFGLLP